MTRITFVISIAVMVLQLCACEEDPATDGGDGPWLVRNDVPANDFKPAEIELAVNTVVQALNAEQRATDLKFSFIPKDLGRFFGAMAEGANHAFTELGVINTVIAPVPSDGSRDPEIQKALQISYVQNHVSSGFNGIGLASMGVELVPEIDAAVDNGLTVITFDSDEPTSKRQLYVGTINTESGKTAGGTMLQLLAGQTTGTVVILGYDNTDWTDGYDRTHEARKVLEAAGLTVVIQHTDWGDQDANQAGILEKLTSASPAAVGCLGVFSNSYLCANAADEAGIIDQIKMVAFDFEPATLEWMEAGKIQMTHVQRQYYMGYIVPYLMYAINVLGLPQTKALVSNIMVDAMRIDTGLDVVPADGIVAYNQYLETLGTLQTQ